MFGATTFLFWCSTKLSLSQHAFYSVLVGFGKYNLEAMSFIWTPIEN